MIEKFIVKLLPRKERDEAVEEERKDKYEVLIEHIQHQLRDTPVVPTPMSEEKRLKKAKLN